MITLTQFLLLSWTDYIYLSFCKKNWHSSMKNIQLYTNCNRNHSSMGLHTICWQVKEEQWNFLLHKVYACLCVWWYVFFVHIYVKAVVLLWQLIKNSWNKRRKKLKMIFILQWLWVIRKNMYMCVYMWVCKWMHFYKLSLCLLRLHVNMQIKRIMS